MKKHWLSMLFLCNHVIMYKVIFVIYLDYSATTPVHEEVLNSFFKASQKYYGNPNSLHKLGVDARNLIEKATNQIASILQVLPSEIIYTSGSSESNNLAIKGIAHMYQNRGKHIITTELEHSSIYGPLEFLKKQGFEISYVKLNQEGMVDIEDLKALMREDTILVTINAVNSELGIVQPVNEIGSQLKKWPKCFFHVDMTQAIGKIEVDCQNIDLISFSAHKFYGMKGIGILIKKEKVELEPLIHGGKSTTKYRSGTPALALIVSMSKALRLAYENLDQKYQQVFEMNQRLRESFSHYEQVRINSPMNAIPHILNISVIGVKPETMLHALEEKDIYISTQSACSSSKSESLAVLALTHDKERAQASIRISLSHLTTKEELEKLLLAFDDCYQNLTSLIHKAKDLN